MGIENQLLVLSHQKEVIAKNHKAPQVSIGLPVYNGQAYIHETLDSLLIQTYTDFELIISDNASTDDTGAICLDFAARDARIRYVRQTDNCGPQANFQFVLDLAVGEFFMWSAADDIHSPNWVEVLVKLLSDNSHAVMAFGQVKYIDSHSNLISSKANFKGFSYIDGEKPRIWRMIKSIKTRSDFLYYAIHKRQILKDVKLTLSPISASVNEQGTSLLYYIVSLGGIETSLNTCLFYRVHEASTSFKGKMNFREIRTLRKAHIDLANHYLTTYSVHMSITERMLFVGFLKGYLFLSDYAQLVREFIHA